MLDDGSNGNDEHFWWKFSQFDSLLIRYSTYLIYVFYKCKEMHKRDSALNSPLPKPLL